MALNHDRIHAYLDATRLVVLSTVDPHRTPASRVLGAFATDGFDVYFSTRRDAEKVRHIEANPRVAVLFQHENQDHAAFVNVVIQGEARAVTEPDERLRAIARIAGRNPRFRDRVERNQLGDSVLFRVRPSRVKVLDRSKGHGPESVSVLEP